MWRDQETGQVVTRHDEARTLRPNTSLPVILTDEIIEAHGFDAVLDTAPPTAEVGQIVEPAGAVQDLAGNWVRQWVVRDLTEAEVVAGYMVAVQEHLDIVAVSFGYDDAIAVISYADEPAVPRYQSEGLAFRAWRSNVWHACELVLADVKAGTRTAPTHKALLLELLAAPVQVPL